MSGTLWRSSSSTTELLCMPDMAPLYRCTFYLGSIKNSAEMPTWPVHSFGIYRTFSYKNNMANVFVCFITFCVWSSSVSPKA